MELIFILISFIVFLLFSISVLSAAANGLPGGLTSAALSGAQSAVTLGISIAGPLCLWSGLARVLDVCGASERVGRLLSPLLRRLFPESARDSIASAKISGNLCANLLGLGNAATPLGIEAVRRMQTLSGGSAATDEMCLLIVLNTASIQLIPSTVAAVRAGLGAAQPLDILPAVWLASLLSAAGGILAAKLFARLSRHG